MNVELWWTGEREFAGSLARKSTVGAAERNASQRGVADAAAVARRDSTVPAALTRDYLRRRPRLVLAGGRAPYRGPASLVAADGSSGTS